MSILFDSSACIAVIRDPTCRVRQRILEAEAAGQRIFVSSIVLFELWYGVAYSARAEENARTLLAFLVNASTVAFDDEDARVAANTRADLRRSGLQIGSYDCLIAAQAMRRNWLLVTADERDFSRISGLRWQNWQRE